MAKSTSVVTMKATPKAKRKNNDAASIPQSLPRYSDSDLEEFREILLRRKSKEQKELEFINDCLRTSNEPSGYTEDGAAGSIEKENLLQSKARSLKTLENIEKALMRIIDKSYGRCYTTNQLIAKDRLRVHPWATQSIQAKIMSR
jgi:RNA polymerase-binding transcription factor DksA